jgi:predicted ABC-type exoprotein transport system permease subunit
MSWHRIFDVVVLVATILGGAAAAMLILAPLVFETVPGAFRESRRLLVFLIILGIVLFALEWLVIH